MIFKHFIIIIKNKDNKNSTSAALYNKLYNKNKELSEREKEEDLCNKKLIFKSSKLST